MKPRAPCNLCPAAPGSYMQCRGYVNWCHWDRQECWLSMLSRAKEQPCILILLWRRSQKFTIGFGPTQYRNGSLWKPTEPNIVLTERCSDPAQGHCQLLSGSGISSTAVQEKVSQLCQSHNTATAVRCLWGLLPQCAFCEQRQGRRGCLCEKEQQWHLATTMLCFSLSEERAAPRGRFPRSHIQLKAQSDTEK